jgi:hypothetical protein
VDRRLDVTEVLGDVKGMLEIPDESMMESFNDHFD